MNNIFTYLPNLPNTFLISLDANLVINFAYHFIQMYRIIKRIILY